MESIRQQVLDWWQNLERWQQFVAIGLGVVGLTMALYLIALAQAPEYAVAFSGLTEQDAAEIVEALKKSNVPYRIEGDGTVIKVPARQVHEVRLDLARQGLPRGGTVGFEIFDTGELGNLGMTDFVQKVNYQRALEGELARTIESLEPLQAARVHIVIPEPSLFLEEERKPSASVLVQLKPGRRLDRGQVEAITHLVASSVQDLEPERVTVVDVEGNVLQSGTGEPGVPSIAQISATQIELQRKYEIETQNRLQSLLDKALGPGRAAVQVSVAMDWDRLETSSEIYSSGGPDAGVIRSSRVVEEYQGQPGVQVGGVPGVDSNQPEVLSYQNVITNTKEGGYLRREAVYNYEVSKTVQNLVREPGRVKRLSVAVLLDESVPPEQQRNIEQMIAAAVGLDPSRGDTLVVTTATFDQSYYAQQQEALRAAQRHELYITGAKALASIVGLILVLFFVRSLFRDLAYRRLYPYMELIPATKQPVPVAALEAASGQLPAGGQPVSLLEAGVTPSDEQEVDVSALPQPEEDEDIRYLQRITMLAREDPDAIADVIRTWLREG
ncbi:MAG TPA: flagellar M-ring protein FliF [Caldilineae bacterium]|nr:flagellar M-ring protein FliF [Caldilineae bacterium]